MLYDSSHGLVDTALEVHRVGTCCHVLESHVDDALCEYGSCGCTVAGIVASLACHALHELCSGVLKAVFEFHFLSHCHTVLGYLRCAKLLLDDHVASLRTECHLYCICQLVNALFQHFAGIYVKLYFFSHNDSVVFCFVKLCLSSYPITASTSL